MGFFKKYKDIFILGLCLGLYVLILSLFKIPCPIKFLTGASCPGCGMTRATLSALRFDFAAAFAYHPLWCIMPPAAILLTTLYFHKKRRAMNVSILVISAALITVYIIRLIWGDGTVVSFNPEESFLYRIISKLFNS